MSLRAKIVTLAIWKWQGMVLAGGTEEGFVAFARQLVGQDIEKSDTGAAGRAYARPSGPWLLWVESLADFPALAHEALHIAAGILEMRGIKHSAESEEAYTYTMEFVLREALNEDGWAEADATLMQAKEV